MLKRPLALPLASLLLVGSPLLAACSGDDDSGDGDGGNGSGEAVEGVGAKPGEEGVPGPDEPNELPASCPFGEKALNEELGTQFELEKNSCVFASKDGARISVSLAPAVDNKTYEETRASYEETADQFATLEVPGQAYAAWSEDELNITVGYLDNAGEYRFEVRALLPTDAGAENVEDLAESLVSLTVDKRDEG